MTELKATPGPYCRTVNNDGEVVLWGGQPDERGRTYLGTILRQEDACLFEASRELYEDLDTAIECLRFAVGELSNSLDSEKYKEQLTAINWFFAKVDKDLKKARGES